MTVHQINLIAYAKQLEDQNSSDAELTRIYARCYAAGLTDANICGELRDPSTSL